MSRHPDAPDHKRIKQFQDMAFMLMQTGHVSERVPDWELKVRIAGVIAEQLVYVHDLQREVSELKMELAVKKAEIAAIKRICENGVEYDD